MNAPVRTMLDDADLARADAYALLAHLLFAPPQASVLSSLREMGQADPADAMGQAWNALCLMTGDAEAIAEEYATLFVSVGKPEVSLYASWYLTGFLMEKPLALLRDDLQRLGLARQEGQQDPEDHMAGELEVMRHLIMRGDAAWQQIFFQQHLQPWYGGFCAALAAAEAGVFYRAVARFMQVFLDMERDYFRLQAADGGVK
ncbi:MAG TPA: molecular chaperone TorD family protein [Rhodocyclaceae bacterium]|nr:molecular chaperone TorD family protein [Rhodocyclaceae bacterium]